MYSLLMRSHLLAEQLEGADFVLMVGLQTPDSTAELPVRRPVRRPTVDARLSQRAGVHASVQYERRKYQESSQLVPEAAAVSGSISGYITSG